MAQNCSNCFNGCAETVSDQCVKYTGIDVPVLGILKGDSLSYVEQALITFLTATLNGTGITLEIDEDLYCELVTQYLQECDTVTALDLFKALVQAACNIQEQIDAINATLATLNADYDVECLDGVTDSSDTHDVVQAIITKLCEIDVELAALALDVDTNYVKISNLNSYIAAYIASTATGTRYSSRMVPFAIQAYYGSLGFFDITGAGIPGTEWEDIYLCNGQNGAPDLRGRVIAGAIFGGGLDPSVNPASSPFNPAYAFGVPYGANSITLTTAQIPLHNHTLTDPEHTHFVAYDNADQTGVTTLTAINPIAKQSELGTENEYTLVSDTTDVADAGLSSATSTGISIAATGDGEAHANNQPALATYFIMYIP